MGCPPSYEEQYDQRLCVEHSLLKDKLSLKRKEILQAKAIISSNIETAMNLFDSTQFQRLMELLKVDFDSIPEVGGYPLIKGELEITESAVKTMNKLKADEEELLCELACFLVKIWDKLPLWNQSVETKNMFNSILTNHISHRREDKEDVLRNLQFKIERLNSGNYNYNRGELEAEIQRINSIPENVLLRQKNILDGAGMCLD